MTVQTSLVGENTGVTVTDVPAQQGVQPLAGGFENFDLDALLPPELKEATKKAEEAGTLPPPDIKDDDTITQTTSASTDKTVEHQTDIVVGTGDDEDPFSAVDKIVQDVLPKETKEGETKEAAPFWKESENYKKITQSLQYTGLSAVQIDNLIQEVIDKSTIDDGKLVTGLEGEVTELKTKVEQYQSELVRLKQIESEALFDAQPETDGTYLKPMKQAADVIRRVLDTEGIELPASKILLAKNKTEFTALVRDFDIEDDQLRELTAQWRSYRELNDKYGEARTKARDNLRSVLAYNVPREKATDIMRKTLVDLMATNEQFKEVKSAIDNGLDKHPHVGKYVGEAQVNFFKLSDALSKPADYVTDPKWMKDLATWTLEAAQTKHIATEYKTLKANYDQKMSEITQLAKAYSQLRESAGGKVGAKGGQMVAPAGNGNGTHETKTDAKKFNDFLSKKISFEDFMKD